jgi:hypothetical protein
MWLASSRANAGCASYTVFEITRRLIDSIARLNHGIQYGAQHHHSQSGPPPPPSMSAQSNPPAPSPYGYDAARRRSLNGGSPPNPYGGKAPLSRAHLRLKLTGNLL